MKCPRTWTCFVLMLAFSALSEGVKLADNTTVLFADPESGRKVLSTRDDFIAAMSPFDRAARMKSAEKVSETDFLEFLSRSVLAWQSDETNRIYSLLRGIREKLAPWHIRFPSTILFIKTSGREEGQASYTRQNAVILPEHEIHSAGLEDTIIHELFHILSRHNPVLRARLYGIIQFHRINALQFPEDLWQRRITNPDGVDCGWAIQVICQGRAQTVVPILYASPPQYDAKKGGEFFNYLTFRLLVLTNSGSSWAPELAEGKPQLIQPKNTGNLFELVGRNTQYVIHPDEILAANFVCLVNQQTNLPTPRIPAEMDKLLKESSDYKR
jgi:hypothetical protein